MKWSKYFAYTLREVPKEAEITSHILMLRAGMIKRLAAGIYDFMPLFVRSLHKFENIVREELNKKDAIEVLMPVVLPAELWKSSGRWEKYGKELWRVYDRKDGEFTLAPTHEEAITDLVSSFLKSYKNLPVNLYQIQTKVRDEIRPRFGLMRAREFVMKDGYSFHTDKESLDQTYSDMYDAYSSIFSRVGLKFKVVEADTGAIGGSDSHEFMVLADNGEDTIASCNHCDWAANLEKAYTNFDEVDNSGVGELELVETVDKKSMDDLEQFFGEKSDKFVKSYIVIDETNQIYLFLVRGDYAINETKIDGIIDRPWKMADSEIIEEVFGSVEGYIGPVNIKMRDKVKIYADSSIKSIKGGYCGANRENYHYKNFSWQRDLDNEVKWDIFHTVKESDKCPKCSGDIELLKGIEVGHIFKLGTKYSDAMRATYTDENGKDKSFVMGCYGIGVTRVVQAAVEQNSDENGIIWTKELAPFVVDIVQLDSNDDIDKYIDDIYEKLQNDNIDVILDDRKERPGVKFKDADLIGFPIQVVVGKRSFDSGVVEIKNRQTGEKIKTPIDESYNKLLEILNSLK